MLMDVTLYSIGCKNCKILEKRLYEAGVKYTLVDDEDVMISKGFMSAPMLEVDGTVMSYGEAIKWLKQRKV